MLRRVVATHLCLRLPPPRRRHAPPGPPPPPPGPPPPVHKGVPDMKARAFAVSLTIAALAPASLLAGCGADNPARPKLTLPAADSFRAGACRDAADPILALGKLTYDRAGKKALPAEDYTFLVEQGEKLL